MHLRRRLMKLQSKFCQKSSKQTSKKAWESYDCKKVSWAYQRGTWGQKKKTDNIRSSLWAKRERQRRSQRIFASWNRRPVYLRSGRLLSAKGETRLPAKLGHLSLSKSHVAIFAPWIEILLHNIYNHAQKHDWKSCSRDPNALWSMELL